MTGPGRGHRRRARPPSRRRQDRVHRLDRGRQVAPARGRRDGRQGDLARARRQEPAGRPRRRRRPRRPRLGDRLGDLLQQRPDLQRRLAARSSIARSARSSSSGSRRSGAKLAPGEPLDPATRLGAIVDERQLDKVLGYVELGRQEGARVVAGGERVREETGGFYVPPTILDGVVERVARRPRGDLRAGPDRDRVRRTRPRRCGSPTTRRTGWRPGIWTRDVKRAHRLARPIRAGVVWVNTFDTADITVPFGGYKQSGFGRDKGLAALDGYTQLKTTWFDLSGDGDDDDSTDELDQSRRERRQATPAERRRRRGGRARRRAQPAAAAAAVGPAADPLRADGGRLGRRARIDPPRLAARARGDRDGLPRRRRPASSCKAAGADVEPGHASASASTADMVLERITDGARRRSRCTRRTPSTTSRSAATGSAFGSVASARRTSPTSIAAGGSATGPTTRT